MDASAARQCCRARMRGGCRCQRHDVKCTFARALGSRLASLSEGPHSFKFLDPLSSIATYPSGARRRAGATGGRAIATAVSDVPPRPRGAICAEDRNHRSEAVPLTADDSRSRDCRLCSQHSAFSSELLARPRAYDRERSTSSRRVKHFHSRAQKSAHAEPLKLKPSMAVLLAPIPEEQVRAPSPFSS